MNVYDSEIVAGILSDNGIPVTETIDLADAILVNTCTVRQHAEDRALGHINQLIHRKKKRQGLKIGLLGCVAQRRGSGIMSVYPGIDFVVGPDGYRLLPELLSGSPVSDDPLKLGYEDYDAVMPARKPGVTAWIAISRGCNERCAYCIVPYTRGRERSRPASSILREAASLIDKGFKEITLLGQNVNSYRDGETAFASLLDKVSRLNETMRVRFATSHPMNLSPELFEVMAERQNVCQNLHIPVQSGSDRILDLMNRRYNCEHYLSLIEQARAMMPDIAVTTDIISGIPTETEEDHQATINLVNEVRFDNVFTFKYSPREGTPAYQLADDVPEEVKIRRLEEVSSLVREIMMEKNQALIGTQAALLVEKTSRRSDEVMVGRIDTGKKVLIGDPTVKSGDLVNVIITECTSQSLFGEVMFPEKIQAFV